MRITIVVITLLGVAYLTFLSLFTSAFSPYQVEASIHPSLAMRGKTADEERLIKINDRIHQAFAYDFSNIFFIEGSDGIIVIDSGWSAEAAARALADYRKISTKPIEALIYSHGHGDHLGGAKVFVNENPQHPVKIYAAHSWTEQQAHFNSALAPHVTMRAAAQLGALLPDSKEGRVNIGVGKMQINDVHIEFIPPTVEIEDHKTIVIADIPIEFIPLASETIDQLLLWFPQDKVMHAGDVAASTLPILSTPRNEPDRSPQGFINAMQLMLDKPLESLIAGHSLPVLGRENAIEALNVQRDAAQFIYDQTIRALNMNLGPREAAEFVQLPSHLANHPLLTESYHRASWLVRGLYARYGGWFSGDAVDLNPLKKREEAERMVILAGGAESILSQAETAFQQSDFQWSAQLANYMLNAGIEEKSAKALKIASLRAMAYASLSGNQRHYMLTNALALELGVGSERVRRRARTTTPLQNLSTTQLLALMGPNVDPKRSLKKTLTLAVYISPDPHKPAVNGPAAQAPQLNYVSIRRGVLQVHKKGSSDVSIQLERAVLEEILANQTSWKSAIEDNKIQISGNKQLLLDFLSSFDFYAL